METMVINNERDRKVLERYVDRELFVRAKVVRYDKAEVFLKEVELEEEVILDHIHLYMSDMSKHQRTVFRVFYNNNRGRLDDKYIRFSAIVEEYTRKNGTKAYGLVVTHIIM